MSVALEVRQAYSCDMTKDKTFEPPVLEDLPAEKRVGSSEVPAVKVEAEREPAPAKKVPSPLPEKSVKFNPDKETVEWVARSFDEKLVNRYGDRDQLVKLWRSHAKAEFSVNLKAPKV